MQFRGGGIIDTYFYRAHHRPVAGSKPPDWILVCEPPFIPVERLLKMKITDVTVFPLISQRPELRVGKPIHPSWWGYDQTLIRIDTEGGDLGLGLHRRAVGDG